MHIIHRTVRATLISLCVLCTCLSVAHGEGGDSALNPPRGERPAREPKPSDDSERDSLVPLDSVEYPIPKPKARPLPEDFGELGLFDDYRVQAPVEIALPDEELAATSALIHVLTKMTFEQQLPAGWFVADADASGVPRADDFSHTGNRLRRAHAQTLCGLLVQGVPPTDRRMVLAYSLLNREVDRVLVAQSASSGDEEAVSPLAIQFLCWAVRATKEWHMRTGGRTDRKGASPSVRKLDAASAKRMQAVVNALSGFARRSAAGKRRTLRTYDLVMALLDAKTLGLRVDGTLYARRVIADCLHLQHLDTSSDPVKFTKVQREGKGPATEPANRQIMATPRGWTDGTRDKGRKAGTIDVEQDQELVWEDTAVALFLLIHARKLLETEGKDPFADCSRAEFDKSIWDGLAYIQSVLGRGARPKDTSVDGQYSYRRPVAGYCPLPPFLSMSATGNHSLSATQCLRAFSDEAVATVLAYDHQEAQRIRMRHAASGGKADDRELRDRLVLHWKEVKEKGPIWPHSGLPGRRGRVALSHTPLLIVLYGADRLFESPVITGGGSKEKPEPVKGGSAEPEPSAPSPDAPKPAEPKSEPAGVKDKARASDTPAVPKGDTGDGQRATDHKRAASTSTPPLTYVSRPPQRLSILPYR